ncbi:arsenate reductase ArsC [Shewanella baltica]|uniref:arsenate reductase ArsC n=1 Tax=Shewanella baltica TaxID=62322 RepID=UPI00217EB6F4|nr:arsenate reductase ArsC [Shewanella baltica]MCS6127124.1 arsenate reductase ArsC [Shewanella baltica]MCS6139076.1 arsenate reductase ArsC [Shewanella baltica]MCS6145216.1 arsenate reductase ArsC [Shewanella baltica]MCS6169746.1 arsenate reductase ArsC [Shewanella baltica]MCS6186970.1 arsenate reductase ArsC [Shewanella baltica]
MKKRVLFLCVGNSARSQLAEALLRHQAQGQFDVFSAGTQPEPIDERTLALLQKNDLDTSELRSKSVSEFGGQSFDFVISLCEKSTQECQSFPLADMLIAWDYPDPRIESGTRGFEQTFRELNERIKMFVLVQSKDIND